MKLTLTDDDEYALTLSEADRVFLVYSMAMSQTHIGDAEYEIATGWSKSAADRHRDAWRLAADNAGNHLLTLAQSDLNLILISLRLCITHVSDAEHEIVIGRRKQDSANELTDLEDQAELAYSERITREMENKGGWRHALARMGDLSLLADDVLADRLAKEASELGIAIEGLERRRTLLQQVKSEALLAELNRRGSDVDAMLSRLLASSNVGVRFAAASELINSSSAARMTLETLADPGKPQLAKAAERTLRRWRRGEIRAKKRET